MCKDVSLLSAGAEGFDLVLVNVIRVRTAWITHEGDCNCGKGDKRRETERDTHFAGDWYV